MNILFMSNEAAGYCIAHKLAQEDNQVFFYAKDPKSRITGKGIKNPLGIDTWQPYVKKSDLIIFDMVGTGKLADALSKSGKKVIGASEFADKIELDRTFGMELVNEYTDAQSSEFKAFKTLAEGITFLKKEEDLYVFKPLNNKFTKWTYVPRRSNEELVDFMTNFQRIHGNNNEFVLQQKVEGIEISMEGWFDGNNWLPPFNHTIESKRFMEGDKSEQTGCYSEDTEILTENGWLKHTDLKIGMKVLTMCPETKLSEYQQINKLWLYDWNGEMCHFISDKASIDLLVTPDHNLVVKNINTDEIVFKKAESLINNKISGYNFIRKSEWCENEKEYFELPQYQNAWNTGNGAQFKLYKEPIKIKMDVWLAFLGLYISEGNIKIKGNKLIGVCISQKTRTNAIEDVLNNLPFKWCFSKGAYYITSVQLANYIKNLGMGYSYEKYIPREFLNLSKRQLNILLEYLIFGDGSVHKRTGHRNYYTSSKRLANDVQELFQKTGSSATLKVRNRIGQKVNTKSPGITRRLSYELSERNRNSCPHEIPNKKIMYKGVVWCVTVPNHIVYVRRNGKAIWCGNCMGNTVWIAEEDRLVQALLLPLTEILRKNKYIGCIDANCIVDKDNIWFLEWTSRFGYSAIQSLLRLYNGSITDFMNAIIDNGKMSFKDEYGIAVRVSLPPFPRKFSDENKKELQGVRAFYYPEKYQDNIWLSDVMFKDNIPVVAGLDGHVCDVTETGKTIEDARKKVYKTIEDIIIPMDIQYRNDIGNNVKEKIEKLNDMGWL